MRSALLLFLLFWAVASPAETLQPKAEPERAKAAEHVNQPRPAGAPIPVEIINQAAEPEGYQDPCRYNQNDSRSDLCAQWTAANAAANAAYYAGWQLWAAAAGMIGLLVTIWLTSRAVKAAQASVVVAQDTGKRQLRAYVSILDKIDFAGIQAGLPVSVLLQARNTGQTPARKVIWNAAMSWYILPVKDNAFAIPAAVDASNTVVASNHVLVSEVALKNPLNAADMALNDAGRAMLYIYGSITYEDVFGDPWHTNYRLYWSPALSRFLFCSEGNDST